LDRAAVSTCRRYALLGENSGSALTYQGRVIVHESREELEFLFAGTKAVELGDMIPVQDTVPLREHPDMARVRFPLRREDFS
jgi:hypothetical protein